MDEVRARQEAIDRAAAEAVEGDKLEREQATATELEERRRAAWLSHRTDEALASGQKAFVEFLNKRDILEGIPTSAWPPGYEPPTTVPGIPAAPADTAGGTLLGQMLAKRGVRI
jgi:hypothetical protein